MATSDTQRNPDQMELNRSLARSRVKVKCMPLKSIPEVSDPDSWTPCPSPKEQRPCNTSGRSRSLPGSVASGLPLPGGRKYAETIKASAAAAAAARSETEIRILVLGYTGVGKSALVVRYLTKRFIGDYAPYETVCSAQTTVDSKQVTVSILDMSWQCHNLDDVGRYLDWCHGLMIVFSLVEHRSLVEVETLCRQLHTKLRRIPSVLVGTKSDLAQARQVTMTEIHRFTSELKCPYVETSARESLASAVNAFVTLIHEIGTNRKKVKRNGNKNGYSSKLQNIRERLRSIAGEFRQRTNTF